MLDEFERVAVLLFDKMRARLYTVFLGEIEERRTIEDEVPGKQATGGWFALAQARYARHHEDHVLRHGKRTIAELLSMLQERPFDRLLLGGPPESVALLRQQLPGPLRSRLAGTLHLSLSASEADVRNAALELAEQVERQAEVSMVNELLEAATSSNAEISLDASLVAISDRRVHLLLVADTFNEAGSECPSCGRLARATGTCPTCGRPSQLATNLRERLVRRVLEQGGQVEMVSGAAAARLTEHGGVGVWTRY
jgi:peptide chain release factor subunit 1